MAQQVSFGELIARMMAAPAKVEAAVSLGVKAAAVKVRDDATKKFGTYQSAVGPYPAWENLKPATVASKVAAGGAEDPLIGHYPNGNGRTRRLKRTTSTGKKIYWPANLRNTIGIKVEGLNAAVGTDDPLGKFHEYGTAHIPPRPFLRPALFENQEVVKEAVKAGVIAGMMNM